MSSNSPKSKSKFEGLGFILGKPIESFQPNVRPSKLDVLRLWMFKYDQKRGSNFRMTPTVKNQVVKEIASDLILVWKSHDDSAKTIKEYSIQTKIKQEIVKIEPLADHHHRKDMSKEGNIVWYKELMENLERIFNIAAPISPETNILPSTSKTEIRYNVVSLYIFLI